MSMRNMHSNEVMWNQTREWRELHMMYMHPTQAPQTDTHLMIIDNEDSSKSPGLTSNIIPDPEMVHPSNIDCSELSRLEHKSQNICNHREKTSRMQSIPVHWVAISAGYQQTNLQQKSGFSTRLIKSFYKWVTPKISIACITQRLLKSMRRKSSALKISYTQENVQGFTGSC